MLSEKSFSLDPFDSESWLHDHRLTDWKVARLKELVSTVSGYHFPTDNFHESGIPIIRIGDIKPRIDSISTDAHISSQLLNSELLPYKLLYGDIVMAMTGATIGKIGRFYLDLPALLNQRVCAFRANQGMEQQYLYYLLQSVYFRQFVKNRSSGAAQENIATQDTDKFKFPLPPLTVQKKIAQYLEKKTSKLDSLKELLSNAQSLLQSYKKNLILKIVTHGIENSPLKHTPIGEIPAHWHLGKIKQVVEYIGSGTTPDTKNERYYNGSHNWIQSGDLYENESILTTEKRVTDSALIDYATLKIYDPPFIVIAMYGGGSVGNVAISKISACTNQACCVIKSKSMNLRYLYYFLKSRSKQLIEQSFGGGQKNINSKIVKNYRCTIPPIEEQVRIADYLDRKNAAIDEIIAKIESMCDAITKYRCDLISAAVSGKISWRVYAYEEI